MFFYSEVGEKLEFKKVDKNHELDRKWNYWKNWEIKLCYSYKVFTRLVFSPQLKRLINYFIVMFTFSSQKKRGRVYSSQPVVRRSRIPTFAGSTFTPTSIATPSIINNWHKPLEHTHPPKLPLPSRKEKNFIPLLLFVGIPSDYHSKQLRLKFNLKGLSIEFECRFFRRTRYRKERRWEMDSSLFGCCCCCWWCLCFKSEKHSKSVFEFELESDQWSGFFGHLYRRSLISSQKTSVWKTLFFELA